MARYRKAFDELRTLSGILVQAEKDGSPESCMAAFRKIKDTVGHGIYSDTEGQREFEAEIDFAMDGIMTSFRRDLPHLQKDDFRLFGYLCAGFDYGTILLLLKCQSPGAFYTRKYRLVEKILALPAYSPDKARYLAVVK